jgi:hypothetical protein
MRRIALLPAAALVVVLIASCGTIEPLPPRNGVNANAIDLSGNWVLRQESGSAIGQAGAEEKTILIPRRANKNAQLATRGRGNSRRDGSAVYLFLESGEALKITQTLHGIFISFDRAIVEEFTFGENRIVSVGPIEAQRVSGWDADDFIAETKDESGAVLTERWSLAESRSVLLREISVVKKEEIMLSTTQVFDRD